MHRFARPLVLLLLVVAALPGPRARAGQESPSGPVAALAQAPDGVAGSAGDDRVTYAELEALLLERHATSERGKQTAMYLGQRALIAHLAREAGIEIGEADVDRRTQAIDAQIRAQGYEGGLAGELAREGIGRDEFRETLRLALLHEELTRRALGLAADAEVSGDQQQLWLDAEVARAGLVVLEPPYTDGVAARLGPVTVGAGELGRLTLQRAQASELREAVTQLLLLRRVERRVTGLTPELDAELVAAEIERRKAEAEKDPRFKGVGFAELLKAQGHTVERLARDPAVRIAALSTHWVETQHDDAALRAFHDENAEFFADHFGEAVHVRAIFLAAAERPDAQERSPKRSMEEAEQELSELAARASGPEEFAVLAATHSEDADTRARGGELGWVVRASRSLPKGLIERVFAAEAGVLGPVRIPTGVLLLWVGERRPAPAWEAMRPHVQRELRRRFLVECLAPADVRTAFDPDPAAAIVAPAEPQTQPPDAPEAPAEPERPSGDGR